MIVATIAIAVPAAWSGGHLSRLPIGGLLIELIALMSAGWMIASFIGQVDAVRGSGPKSAAGLVLLCLVSLVSPRTLHWLWTGPSPSWRIVHVRWSVIGLVSVGKNLVPLVHYSPFAINRQRTIAQWSHLEMVGNSNRDSEFSSEKLTDALQTESNTGVHRPARYRRDGSSGAELQVSLFVFIFFDYLWMID